MPSLQIAVFPGTFDPITLGHLDIVRRAAAIFESVVVAVACSPCKRSYFAHEQRINLVQAACQGLDNVSCMGFKGLMIDFLRAQQARILVRGVRTVADYDYEMQLTGMYRTMMPELEIVLLPSSGQVACISSTLVREILVHQGDISAFVPRAVARILSTDTAVTTSSCNPPS